jgi:hypothetical protein
MVANKQQGHSIEFQIPTDPPKLSPRLPTLVDPDFALPMKLPDIAGFPSVGPMHFPKSTRRTFAGIFSGPPSQQREAL